MSTSNNQRQRVVVITGATDGIGLALAQRLHSTHTRLVLVGRRPLRELDQSLFNAGNYCEVDLSTEDAADRIAIWLECANVRYIDQLYLNAAQGYVGGLASQSEESIRQMIAVNLWTPIALVHRLAPLLTVAEGQIVFISSIMSSMPSPDFAIYSATKAALEGFVRSLRIELRAQNIPIRLSLLRPGATHTGMHAKSGADPASMDWRRFPSAESTARKVATAARRNRNRANLGLANHLIYWTGRILSPLVVFGLRRRSARLNAGPQPNQANQVHSNNAHIVITGGAAGIGAALATEYVSDPAMTDGRITIIDADADSANKTASTLRAESSSETISIDVIEADLSTQVGLRQIKEQLGAGPPITLFVNNAGISSVGPFLTSTLSDQKTVLDVNFVAPVLLTAWLLREHQLASSATITFLSSLSHFVSYPGAAVYAASKDGLASLSTSLRAGHELSSLHFLTVYPGPTRTDHAARYSPDNRHEHRRMPPEQVAGKIRHAITKRRGRLIPGVANRITAVIARLFPPIIERIMARTIFAKLIEQQSASPPERRNQT